MKKFRRFIIVVLVLAVALGFAVNVFFPTRYESIIESVASKYGFSKEFITAVIKTESGFDVDAVSNSGAKGLMQITDETAAWCAEKMGMEQYDVFDFEDNINIGTYYLSYLYERFGSIELGVVAYNAGPSKLDEWIAEEKELDDIPYEETKKYIQKIKIYESIYNVIYQIKDLPK